MVADVLAVLLFGGSGQFAIAPDNLGYGESYNFHKGYIVRDAYKASAATLWSKASHIITNEYGSHPGCGAVASGYSEGGIGAAAAAQALSCIGVEVVRVQMGAG